MAANVQSMCQYWKNINLQELQRDLDTTATELANRQDESDGSRKKLVEQSRDFKKNTPEDIRKIVAPLLKSFQLEIDSLSKRSKAAEAAFLSIYKKLIDLPDPVPALEHAQTAHKKAQRVQDLEIENKQLRETLDEYNHEFAEVKNQEVTIKQLKEKLKEHEERLEVTAQTRAKEKERELQRQFAEKERHIQDGQLAVAKKLGEAEHTISSLRTALESVQSELFEVKSKYDETTSAKSDEMDMVMADLERANERAANAERQSERLKNELAQASENLAHQTTHDPDTQGPRSSASDQAMDILKRSTLEVELAAKEKEIAQLVEDVQRLQASLSKLRESTSSQVNKLEEELSTKNQAFRSLEDRLRTQEDYEEIKRELRVMKSIEFAGAYQEGSRPEESKSLEMLLLEKNKGLQAENTHLKVVNTGLTDPDMNTTSTTTTTPSIPPPSPSSSSPSTIVAPFTSRSFGGLPHSSASLTGCGRPLGQSSIASPPSSSSTVPSSSSSSAVPTSSTSTASSSSLSSTTAATTASSPRHRFSSPSLPSDATTTAATTTTTSSLSGLFPYPGFSPLAIKKESPSPAASVSSNPPPFPTNQDSPSQRASVGTPFSSSSSTGRQSPCGSVANCKLSPEIPTPSQTPNHTSSSSSNNVPPPPTPPIPSPIAALHPHLDPRHFTPPLAPHHFYPFQGSPFHAAFMPLNMVKSEITGGSSPSAGGGLDTGYVAKNVRELLSIHNIGQRLFAKHVLGLSQGTVSELLSKPKSWDKLTEKGRESYRKMHAWANDDANIMALKAISPKKGTQPLAPNNSYKEKEDAVTEERIALILNEAQMQMHMKKSLEQQQVVNAVESSIYHSGLSKMGGIPPGFNIMSPTLPPNSLVNGPHFPAPSRENSTSSRGKGRDPDSRHHSSSSSQEESSSAQELVTRIYRQELEKLKSAADAAGNLQASAMYSHELGRLNTPSLPTGVNVTSSSSSPPSVGSHQHHHHHPHHLQRSQSSPTPSGGDAYQSSSLLALDYRPTSRPNGLKVKTEPLDNASDSASASSLTSGSNNNNYGAIDLSKPSSRPGSTPGSSSPTSDPGQPHSGSAFFAVRPRVNGHDLDAAGGGTPENPHTPTQQSQGSSGGGPRYGSVPPAECLSPLQRMQNIANSLTSRPQMGGLANSKPLRAVLPPITQEEFDRYANMNTDDLVKKVKETLSQYSISQRLFGESVLGLSQGSVSDLLARPKPWHMLTQKGREPFIRMQVFLEDPDSIPRLVASQYRIPPDKLMRSNSRGSNESEAPCDPPVPRSQGIALPLQHPLPPHLPPPPPPPRPHPPAMLPSPHSTSSSYSSSSFPNIPRPQTASPPPPQTPLGPCSPPLSPSSPPSACPLTPLFSSSTQGPPRHTSLPHLPPPPFSLPQSPSCSLSGGLTPTTPLSAPILHPGMALAERYPNMAVAAAAAAAAAASAAKAAAAAAASGNSEPSVLQQQQQQQQLHQQRIWGAFAYQSSMLEVIAMTSEIDTLTLTSRVKDVLQFHNLGQKLFGEAVLGLSQGSVSELLSKPKPWHMLSVKGREPFIKMHLWLADGQNVERLKLYQSQMKAHRRRKSSMDDRSSCFDSPTQPKRPRVFFTEEQKDSLRQAYAQDPYPNQTTIENLAKGLGVGVKTVINWFHNHRMRAKQQHHVGVDGLVKSEPDESSNQSDLSSVSASEAGTMSANAAGAMSMMMGMGGQFFQAGGNPTDLNQWMFPQFEAMPLMRKLSAAGGGGGMVDDSGEDNKENNGGLEDDDDDEMDEPDGIDASNNNNNNNSSCSNSNNNNNNNGSMTKDDAPSCGGGDDDNDRTSSEMNGDDHNVSNSQGKGPAFIHPPSSSLSSSSSSSSSTFIPSSSITTTTTSTTGSNHNNNNIISSSISSGVNKRKRSNPQRVYEGAQLDRTVGSATGVRSGSVGVDLTSRASTIAEEDAADEDSCGDSDSSSPRLSVVTDAFPPQHQQHAVNGTSCPKGVESRLPHHPHLPHPHLHHLHHQAAATGNDRLSSSSSSSVLFGVHRPGSEEVNSDQRIRKIEKIQNAIKTPVEMWDEEEGGATGCATSSIQKMEKHIETNATDEEDWEF